MSAWKDDDEVTTTYGSIQLSLEQAHAAGIKTEQERIIKLLEKWGEDNDRCYCCNNDVAADDLTALIKGETNE
jgi:hypothetical protein